jgi:serine/threonine protein kinase
VANTVELRDDDATEDGPPVETQDAMLGRTLLHYRITRRLGQGGMSVVYHGRDEKLGRDVAIKVLHPFLAEKAECRARLVREARAVARLENENILRIFDASADPLSEDGTESGNHSRDGFLITELVVGSTLRAYAENEKLREVPEVGAMIAWQLARALAHAHSQGVIHRDIKPENVMVRQDGVLKLMDFGIAQIVDAQSLTITGTLLGSPAHMPPECIEGIPADIRSDIFSLGTVLYWLTTGHLPFSAASPHALLKSIVDGKWLPPQQRQPRISDALAKIIHKSMARKPEHRFGTATEMADALGQALEDYGLTPDAPMVSGVLKDPAQQLPEISKRVRQASLARAETLLRQDKPARALSVLARVLAEYPNDPEAVGLLERAEEGADALGEERESVVPLPVDEPDLAPERNLESAANAATLETRIPPKRARISWISVALSVGIISLMAAVWAISDLADKRVSSDSQTEGAQATSEEPAMSLVRLEPGAQPATDRVEKKDDANPQVIRKSGSLGSGGRVRPEGLKTKSNRPKPRAGSLKLATLPISRVVEIKINTWASLSIDGKVIARNTKREQVSLTAGKHLLEITNPAAIPHRQELEVPAAGPVPRVTVQLRRKPAQLKVYCNIKDADIAIRIPGSSGGKSLRLLGKAVQSVNNPLRVPLEAGTMKREYEIIVHKTGFTPKKFMRTFVPGDLVTLRVVLEPSS